MKKIVIDYVKKQAIASVFRSKTKTIKEIAACVGVSTRTIGRILVEMGEMPAKVKKTEADQRALSTLQSWNIKPGELNDLLQQLEDYGFIDMVNGKVQVHERNRLNQADVIMRMAYADKDEYEMMLTKIIHTREAIKYNTSVQAAMLKLEQATFNAATKPHEQPSTKQ